MNAEAPPPPDFVVRFLESIACPTCSSPSTPEAQWAVRSNCSPTVTFHLRCTACGYQWDEHTREPEISAHYHMPPAEGP